MKKLIFIFTSLLLLSLSGCTQEIEVGFEGNGVSVNSIIIEQGESVSNFQRPTRPNYQFDGWFLDASLNRPAPDRLTPEEDITLYAKWTRLYNVNFNTNEGSSVSNIVIRENTNFNLSEINNPTRANHVFDGWFLNESLNQSAPSNFTINADVTIFAKWLRILNVTFNTNGGPNIETISLNENSNLSLSEIPTPSRANHRFDGWFLDEELMIPAPSVIMVENNLTLHSKWIGLFTVSFDSNQGSNISSVIIDENTAINLNEITDPVRLDYRFEGWFLDSSLTMPAPHILKPNENITLYAKWVATFNTVTFSTNLGSSLAPLRIYEESILDINELTIPTRESHRFDGWYLDAELTVPAPENIELEEDITLYAKWVRGFTVTFNTNGGSSVNPINFDENETFDPSQVLNPQKTGYIFVGWYTDSNLTSRLSQSVIISENFVLYARWSENLATSISLNRTQIGLERGKTFNLTSTISPSDATNQQITYSSSNSNIASVNSNGQILGVNEGIATITATTTNGKTATVRVLVRLPVGARIIQEIEPNGSFSLADFLPQNGTTFRGTNSSKNEVDIFRVTVPANVTIGLLVTPENRIDLPHFLIGLYTASDILVSAAIQSGSSLVLTHRVTLAGTYYIRVMYSLTSPYSRGDGYTGYIFWE